MDEAGQKKTVCCGSANGIQSSCRVEAIISVDERGQMVLPKELRERCNIKAGDKMAVISWEREGKICWFTMIKSDNLAEQVKGFLSPIMANIGNSKS